MATVGDITKEMTGMGEKTEEALEWSWSGITKARAMEHSPGITHKGGGRQGEDNTTTPSPNKLSKSDNGKLHTPHRKSKEKKTPYQWDGPFVNMAIWTETCNVYDQWCTDFLALLTSLRRCLWHYQPGVGLVKEWRPAIKLQESSQSIMPNLRSNCTLTRCLEEKHEARRKKVPFFWQHPVKWDEKQQETLFARLSHLRIAFRHSAKTCLLNALL